MEIIKRGLNILRKDGFVAFFYCIYLYLRGELSIGYVRFSVNGSTARFIAEDGRDLVTTQVRIWREYGELSDLLEELKPEHTFYDIGANTGVYTCLAAQNCSQVVSFEPYPPNITVLKENIKLNAGNVSVFEVALSNETGYIGFSSPDTPIPGYGKGSINKSGDNQVRSVCGDELIDQEAIPQPNIIKIDVEGAESLVIDGLKKTLSDTRCRVVYCEVHISNGPTGFNSATPSHTHRLDMETYFEQIGFDVTEIKRDSERFVLKAKRR